ncbi:MAG: hypothetical protein AAFQ53_10140, partial [Bacteroidota bacterium]
LVRGRFRSKLVECEDYKRTVVRYIDHNPVEARMCSAPGEYTWGSARRCLAGTSPRWHERSWIDAVVGADPGRGEPFDVGYRRCFGRAPSEGAWRWIESYIRSTADDVSRFDDLIHGAAEDVRGWMRTKARVADGGRVGDPVADLGTVDALARGVELAPLRSHQRGPKVDERMVLRVAMCRLLAAEGWVAIGIQVGRGDSNCARIFRTHHDRLMHESSSYARAAEYVTREAVTRMTRS